MINDYPHGFKGLKVELRVVGPKEKVIFKDAGTCDLEADSLAKPFESKERLAHIKGFAIPKNAKPGEYQVRLAVFDRKVKKSPITRPRSKLSKGSFRGSNKFCLTAKTPRTTKDTEF